jgi:regulator of RNase E activity RraA
MTLTTNVGLRVFARPPTPERDLLDVLANRDLAHLADAMHGFGVVDPAIRPLFTPVKRAVGPALTMKVHPGDNLVARKGMNLARSGDVMVIDSRGDVTNAVLGGISAEELAQHGVQAIIVDGAVRDRAHITRVGFPVYARAVHPAPPTFSGPGEINVPVCCGGVVVEPGDVVVADEEGIVVIPWRDLDAVLDSVDAVEKTEAGWLAAIEANESVPDAAMADRALDELGIVTHDECWSAR